MGETGALLGLYIFAKGIDEDRAEPAKWTTMRIPLNRWARTLQKIVYAPHQYGLIETSYGPLRRRSRRVRAKGKQIAR